MKELYKFIFVLFGLIFLIGAGITFTLWVITDQTYYFYWSVWLILIQISMKSDWKI